MGGFCPDDWHGTTELDLQQMAAGEEYWFWIEGVAPPFGPLTSAERAENKVQYAIHDAAIAQARGEGLVFHTLPEREQSARLDAAEAMLAERAKS